MDRLGSVLSAEDFVRELEKWRVRWRRNAHGSRAGLRHARDVARKRIRRYKRLRGIGELPKMHVSQSVDEIWNEASPLEVKLVFPYRLDSEFELRSLVADDGAFLPEVDTEEGLSNPVFKTPNSLDRQGAASDTAAGLRRRLKRMLHQSIERHSDRHVDLINAGGAIHKTLPSVADAQFGEARAVRGLYLESIGAAILPHLSRHDVAALEAEGATVLDNEIVAVVDPVDSDVATAEQSRLWHLDHIDIRAARRKGLRGKGVLVGVLDTGIDPDHPEFLGKSIEYQAFDGKGVPIKHGPKDYDRHGTHVSAICAGRSVGVAPDASLAVAAVLTERNSSGQMYGFLHQIIAGINWLARHASPEARGVHIINASLGGPVSEAPHYYETIFGHRTAGKLMVASIGNEGKSGMGTHSAPGLFNCVLAVGASDANDHVAKFSAWGSAFEGNQPIAEFKPDLVAPGVNIYSALPGSKYGERSGTSMACPVVSGAAALLIGQDASLSVDADELTRKLLTLTKDLPEQLHNSDKRCYGRGRLHLAGI